MTQQPMTHHLPPAVVQRCDEVVPHLQQVNVFEAKALKPRFTAAKILYNIRRICRDCSRGIHNNALWRIARDYIIQHLGVDITRDKHNKPIKRYKTLFERYESDAEVYDRFRSKQLSDEQIQHLIESQGMTSWRDDVKELSLLIEQYTTTGESLYNELLQKYRDNDSTSST